MISLFIDTTSNQEITVRLEIEKKVFEQKVAIENNRTQVVLPTVQKLLEENHLSVHDINQVSIHPGPGSFTGVRVGAAIANALIFGLGLPQNLVEPQYS